MYLTRSVPSLVITACAIFATAGYADEYVYFADPLLKSTVEQALGIEDPNKTDMLRLTTLDAHRRGIQSLVGLEYATNLKDLRLYSNNITDISPLTGPMSLEYLDVEHNQISDVSPLGSLTMLSKLELSYNQVNDISPLDGMTNLGFLRVRSNQISDVSLSDLPSLWFLDLVGIRSRT